MNTSSYRIILLICQILTYIPLMYDHRNKRFKKSKILQIYSIFLHIASLFYVNYTLNKWIKFFLPQNYGSRSDIMYIIVICILYILPLYFLLYNSVFQIDYLLQLANDISNYQIFKLNDSILHRRLRFQAIIEFLLIPLSSVVFGFFLNYVNPEISVFNSTLSALILMLITSSIFPFSIIIQYYVSLYRHFSTQLDEILRKTKNTDEISAICEISEIYTRILEIRQTITNFVQAYAYLLNTMFLIVIFSLAFVCYFLVSSLVLQEKKVISLVLLKTIFSIIYCMKHFAQIVFPCQALENENKRLGAIFLKFNYLMCNRNTNSFKTQVRFL